MIWLRAIIQDAVRDDDANSAVKALTPLMAKLQELDGFQIDSKHSLGRATLEVLAEFVKLRDSL